MRQNRAGGWPPALRGGVLVTTIILASLLVAAACAAAGGQEGTGPSPSGPAGYQGNVLSTPLRKAYFTLTDTSGAPYDFASRTEGYVTLVYFGYTNCPDVCPDHFNNIAAALDNLPGDVAERVKVVFISVDPDRDTPDRMREWLDLFDPSFIGLTGDFADVDAVMQRTLGPFYAPVFKEDVNSGYYSATHTDFVLAYTGDNYAHIMYPFGTGRVAWESDLPALVQDGWRQPAVTAAPTLVESQPLATDAAQPAVLSARPRRVQESEARSLLSAEFREITIKEVKAAIESAFEAHPDAARFMSQGLTIPESRIDLETRICGSRPEGAPDSILLACSTLQACARLARVLYDFHIQSGYEEFYEAALAVFNYVFTSLPNESDAYFKLLRSELRVTGLPDS